MRGMIAYIPLSVNLTSTQGCIRGLAHACVCGGGEGGGGCRKENSHLSCKLHFSQGYMKGLMTVGERYGEF